MSYNTSKEVHTYPNYDGKEWEIIKSNYGGWFIVTKIQKGFMDNISVTYRKVYCSRIKFIRTTQFWILKKLISTTIEK